MPAQYLDDWSPAFLVASHEALVTLIDAHATDPGSITIHDAADVLLATIPLTKPCGTVNQTTGALTLTTDGREENATAGTASYASLRDGAGAVYHSLPCEAGVEPVAGKVVLNTLAITAGAPVEIDSVVIE